MLRHLPEEFETERLLFVASRRTRAPSGREGDFGRAAAVDALDEGASDGGRFGSERASGAGRLVWHTGDAVSPPFMDEFLSRHGFEKTEDLEVLAFELGDGPRPMLPRPRVPTELCVTLARNEAELREAHATASRVFPNFPALFESEISAYLRGVEHPTHEPGGDAADRTLRFLARLPDSTRERSEAVATAGAQIAGETARLWGAATLPEHRRRGAYGALVVERCRFAQALGATLALAKANAATSSPLLRDAGFRTVASERRHALQTF